MKLSLILLLSIVILSSSAYGQRFELAVMGGYQFGGMLDETEQAGGVFHYGNALGLDGSGNFGIVADVRLGTKTQLELSFDRQPTALNFHDGETGEITKASDINVYYYQVGLIHDWSQTRIRPFIGGSIGMVHLAPAENVDNESRVMVSPILGLKTFVSEHFALRLHARFLLGNMPSGHLFKSEDGGSFHHEKSTFMTQFQIGFGCLYAF